MGLSERDLFIGVGVDICDVARMQEAIGSPLYAELTFTPEEIAYCELASGNLRAERYAARFAAKEAVAKAIGGIPHSFTDICILKEETGKPRVELRGRARDYAQMAGIDSIFLSISHITDAAVAFSIAVRRLTS